jgi:hypothetical protein
VASLADLPGSAQALLDAFEAQLTAQGVDLPTDPATGVRQVYIAPGIGSLFAWDQPCLSLVFDSVQQGVPGAPDASNLNTWALTFSATFNIVLLRDVSTLNDTSLLPTPANIAADAAVTMTDAVSPLEAATAIKESPPDFDGRQLPLVIHQVMSVGPEGGIAGNALQITTVLA